MYSFRPKNLHTSQDTNERITEHSLKLLCKGRARFERQKKQDQNLRQNSGRSNVTKFSNERFQATAASTLETVVADVNWENGSEFRYWGVIKAQCCVTSSHNVTSRHYIRHPVTSRHVVHFSRRLILSVQCGPLIRTLTRARCRFSYISWIMVV